MNTTETPVFYGTEEVAKFFKCSIPTARSVMRRHDFPLIKVGKNFKVMKSALEQWATERRI